MPKHQCRSCVWYSQMSTGYYRCMDLMSQVNPRQLACERWDAKEGYRWRYRDERPAERGPYPATIVERRQREPLVIQDE